MKKYELTELDIRILIGVAAAYTVDQHKYPKLIEGLLAEFAAEISCAVSDHLSGEKKLPEEDIQFEERANEELSRVFNSLS